MAARSENKKELAYLLYLQGITQKEILERVGIGSSRTLTSWIQKGGWKEKVAAKTITRTELINRTLMKINELLAGDGEIEADKLSKLAALVEKLDKQDSPVVIMDVLIAFGQWMQSRASIDPEVSLEFIKKINKYQDLYITNKING
ncbi:MAG: terminase [Bacteroidales bacterium]|nr:terminase [Bacteroidales bacterium]